MDNTSILFRGIQRIYRNAIVDLIRKRFTEKYGNEGIQQLQKLFSHFDPESGKTRWDHIKDAANERRPSGTGEISTPVRDEFDLLGVESFFNIFEKFFELLCPTHSKKPNKEKNQAKQTLIMWMKFVKNARDPMSHPTSDDYPHDDSWHTLYCAQKILEYCENRDAASQIRQLRQNLQGDIKPVRPEAREVSDFVARHHELEEEANSEDLNKKIIELVLGKMNNCFSDWQDDQEGNLRKHLNVKLQHKTGLDIEGNLEIDCYARIKTPEGPGPMANTWEFTPDTWEIWDEMPTLVWLLVESGFIQITGLINGADVVVNLWSQRPGDNEF